VIGLLQRVSQASVMVAGETLGRIDTGLAVLVGVQRGDGARERDRLLERVLGYRVFPDADGRMNRSVQAVGGGLLLVPQFTLAADTRKGTRAGFGPAAAPEEGRYWFESLVEAARAAHAPVATGRFGAHMQVWLINDGPVTFWLETSPSR